MTDELAGLQVGWVGTGRMGNALAGRLLDAGVELAVFNRSAEKADALVARGAIRLDRLSAATRCDVIISSLPDDAALASVASGLFAGASSRATLWIDTSTVSAGAAEGAATIARAAGVLYASAPVSGNPSIVEAGGAIFALSGDPDGMPTAHRVLGVLGAAVHQVGTGAQANVVKLCVNALLAVTMQSVAEIAVLAEKSGVSRADLMEFVNESPVGSRFTRAKTRAVVNLDLAPTFTPAGQRKDIRLALDAARRAAVPMPVLSATEVAYSRVVDSGVGEGRDFAAVLLDVAQAAGVRLESQP